MIDWINGEVYISLDIYTGNVYNKSIIEQPQHLRDDVSMSLV